MTTDLHRCRYAPQKMLYACLPSGRQGQRPEPGAATTPHLSDHPLGAGGVTATLLLEESHLCVSTWPEQSKVALDVDVCNFGADQSAKAHTLMNAQLTLFNPTHATRHTLQSGEVFPMASERSSA